LPASQRDSNGVKVNEIEFVKCQRCGQEVPVDDTFVHGNQTLCEDCYLKGSQQIQACDPFAVRSAERFRKLSGLEAAEGLTELQKAIYDFIKSKGKVTGEELFSSFHISVKELENQLAILRHCGLVKGQKEGNKVYLTPF
jgi:late competence protein required for DNA uptake (superfamily II DNA/RNA helicase)